MGRVEFICVLISIQLLGCLSKDCPEFRKDVQWMNVDKGIASSIWPNSARKCQQWCQDYSQWDDLTNTRSYPCVGWSLLAGSGKWSSSTRCYLFGNTTGGEPLQSTGSSAPGAVSGLKNDCDKGRVPTIAEMILEGFATLNNTDWKYMIAEDTDIDLDGEVSDIELGHKFEGYMEQLFKMMDQDKNGILIEEEVRTLRLDLPGLIKILDAVFETWPIKSYLLVADRNGDGVLDKKDFLLPEKPFRGPLNGSKFTEYSPSLQFSPELQNGPPPQYYPPPPSPQKRTKIELKGGNDNNEGRVEMTGYYAAKIGHITQNEGNVICKSLGFKGLKKVVDQYSDEYFGTLGYASTQYTCDGTEEILEDCSKKSCSVNCQAMGVICDEEIGSLHIIGGKDASSGDIFLGNKALGCAPHDDPDWHQKQSEVICRELGFPGVVRTTRRSAFTRYMRPRPTITTKRFKCQGDEKKLSDCPIRDPRDDYCYNYGYDIQGIFCNKTDGGIKIVENKFLEKITDWPRYWLNWEEAGKHLFIADGNNDGKLTSDEIIGKAKDYMETMFNFMDQTRDGFMSVKDFTTLHMTVGPMHQVVDRLFENTGEDGEINMMRPVIMGINVLDFIGFRNMEKYDMNNDTKLNADDFYLIPSRKLEKSQQLIPVVSKKLDKNQDGKLQLQEVKDFMEDIFKKLDLDGDGALTFEDAFGLMQENGVSCLSVLEWRSFLPRFTEAVDTQFGAMMSYFFKELDEDRNGEIGLKEFQQLHVPCAWTRREVEINPNRRRCNQVLLQFFDSRKAFNFLFPSLPFSGRNRGGPGGRRDQEDEMAEAACKMLT